MTSPVIIVHGGAGKYTYEGDLLTSAHQGVTDAVRVGFAVLEADGSALDAVQAAVCALEDNPFFNAGYGSVLTSEGEIEMDASIMCGNDLNAGGVTCVSNVKNPIVLARKVMDDSPHVLLAGQGAIRFAEEVGIETVTKESLMTDKAIRRLGCFSAFGSTDDDRMRELLAEGNSDPGHDTVGAIALDKDGNVAYANSTGGISNKRPGRVGDSPIIGAGGYADNEVGAATSTGHGEKMSQVCLCHYITMLMRQGLTAEVAAKKGLQYLADRVGGSGGVIVLDKIGGVATEFAEKMAWAWVRDGVIHFGIHKGEHMTESYGQL